MIKSALIFAAGRGERLRPLTNKTPKPLCALTDNMTLLDRILLNLAQQGIEHIVINHAYLGGMIKQHVKKNQNYGLKIDYSPEPPGALETAGAIIQALPLLGDNRFLTISSDIFTNYNYKKIQIRPDYPIHLVLVPKQSHTIHADFNLTESGMISYQNPKFTFGNIACFEPGIFKNMPIQRLKLAQFLRAHIQQKHVSGELYTDTWLDTGSIHRLTLARQIVRQE